MLSCKARGLVNGDDEAVGFSRGAGARSGEPSAPVRRGQQACTRTAVSTVAPARSFL